MSTSISNPAAVTADFIKLARDLFGRKDSIPLHAPEFAGREKEYVLETIATTFVSTVGAFVNRFEAMVAGYAGAGHAVAAVNGTAALHMSLLLAGVKPEDEVITQPVTFVATGNAIRYCGAHPVFVDIEQETLGLSPSKLESFLEENACYRDGACVNKFTRRPMRACVPVHTLGHPADAAALRQVCDRFGITLIEDAAEALGSWRQGRHAGLEGKLGVLSFNGNKTVTTGGGGMILTADAALAERARHLTTTAKQPHRWEYRHDAVGFNYRMPNLNAALGCAQMERLEEILSKKRALARIYAEFFAESGITFVREPRDCQSNYWLNAVVWEDRSQRDNFLRETNERGVGTRPFWEPLHKLPMFEEYQTGDLATAEWLADRLVTLPSGPGFQREGV